MTALPRPVVTTAVDSSRPRVLFVITTTDVGGTETVLRELTLRLDRSAFNPLVCSLCAGGRVAREIVAAGIPVLTLGMADPPRIRELGPATVRLARLIDHLEVDLVQAFLYRANVIAGLAARLSRRRPVVVAGQRSLTPLRGRPAALAARLTRRFTDHVVAVSDAVRNELIRVEGLDPARIAVIPNGVDTTRYRLADREAARAHLGIPTDAFVVAGVGRLSPEKGFHDLIESAALARGRGVPVQIVLAGDGPERKRLAAQATSLGLDGTVRFLGMRTDPAPVYAAADIFALPSQEEGSPNALLEAMACACAVLASNVGGVPAIVEHERSGLLVPPRSPSAFADALVRLAEQPHLRERLGREARRQVTTRFSMAAMVDAHAQLYRRLLAGAA